MLYFFNIFFKFGVSETKENTDHILYLFRVLLKQYISNSNQQTLIPHRKQFNFYERQNIYDLKSILNLINKSFFNYKSSLNS